MKIAVAETGYVGLSIATLLSQHNPVIAVDVIPEKVDKINCRVSPIQDEYIEKYLAEKNLDLTATFDGATAYRDADFVVIAAPTNYDPVTNYFNTYHIEDVIDLVLRVNLDAVMVIKSTIPVGHVGRVLIEVSPDFYCSTDVVNLWSGPKKAKQKLGWDPSKKTSFEQLVNLMVDVDMAKVTVERAGEQVRTDLAEYLEKGIMK